MERTYGSKYSLGQALSLAGIAKLIRADIKAAVAAGELPAKLKVSVQTKTYSGGGAIDIRVTAGLSAFDVYTPVAMRGFAEDVRVAPYAQIADRWAAYSKTLNSIHAAYNHDGSDVMTDYFDVRYYGGVSIEWRLDSALRAAAIEIHNDRAIKPRHRYVFPQTAVAQASA